MPTVDLPERYPSLCLACRADGAVVGLWGSGNEGRIFTVAQGKEFRIVATLKFPGAQAPFPENQRLFADSQNNVWYTADGRAECLHIIQPDECAERGRVNRKRGSWNVVAAFEDAQRRMWFRTEGAVYNHASIRGLLVFEGGTFTLHDLALPESANLPRVGALAQKDPDHLWVTTTEEGLCNFDVATATRRCLPDQPADLRRARFIFQRGADWLFLCNPNAYDHAGTLWRLRGERWEKLIDNVDASPGDSRRRERLWTRAATGNFLAGVGSGLWFVPDEGAPVGWTGGAGSRSPRRTASSPCRPARAGWAWTPTAGAGSATLTLC